VTLAHQISKPLSLL